MHNTVQKISQFTWHKKMDELFIGNSAKAWNSHTVTVKPCKVIQKRDLQPWGSTLIHPKVTSLSRWCKKYLSLPFPVSLPLFFSPNLSFCTSVTLNSSILFLCNSQQNRLRPLRQQVQGSSFAQKIRAVTCCHTYEQFNRKAKIAGK